MIWFIYFWGAVWLVVILICILGLYQDYCESEGDMSKDQKTDLQSKNQRKKKKIKNRHDKKDKKK